MDSTKLPLACIDVFGIETACCCFFFSFAAVADSSRWACVLIAAVVDQRESINWSRLSSVFRNVHNKAFDDIK